MVYFDIIFVENIRGKGYWKFNCSLLHDSKCVNDIKHIIEKYRDEYESLNDKGLVWDLIKMKIREQTIKYSSFKKKHQN